MTDYYVDYANGNDSNNGTSLSTPFKTLKPFDEGQGLTLSGGDNIYLRDTATIMMNETITFVNATATVNNRITIQGYQNEKPTLDWSGMTSAASRAMYFFNPDGYIDFSQFIIRNVTGNALQVDGLNGNVVNDCTFTDIEIYDYGTNADFSGNAFINFGRVYDSEFTDCIGMYGHGGGATPADRSSGNSDAFYIGGNATHGYAGGTTMTRCIAAYNADDGFDFFDNDPSMPCYMIDCLAYGNGQDHPTSPTSYGDGNGFKTGGGGGTGNIYSIRCVAWDNFADGFDTNAASERCFFHNCTSYNNGSYGFQFTGSTEPDHVATNCIAYNNGNGPTGALYNCVSTTNTWDLGITNPQFASTTYGNADFLRLDAGSPCIDVGTDLGYSYLGSAPDLGAYEYGTGTPTYQGTKATALAGMTEPLGVSAFSGTVLSKAEMKAPIAYPKPIGNHLVTQSVVDQFTTTTYYVDPLNGSDLNTGQSLGDAFASLEPVTGVALSPGDTIKVRDTATMNITSGIDFQNISGTLQEPIVIEAYQEESPVIDASGMSTGTAFRLGNVTHFELRDIKIQNAPESALSIGGLTNNVVVENVEVDTFGLLGAGSGIILDDPQCTGVTVRNCLAHHGSWAGTSDGFAVVNGSGGHTFENCTAYRNCDDGFGLFDAEPTNGCTFIKCNAYLNGDNGSGVLGDGNGWKLGGSASSGGHTLQFCKSWDNTRRGYEASDTSVGSTLTNCTSYSNTDVGFRDNVGLSTYQNCLSWQDTTATSFGAGVTETTNSWNLATGDPLFVSTTYAEGSVGSTFLRLNTGSPAIDVGTNVGLPYSGTAPDLGAHEFATATTYYVDPVTGSDANNGLTTGAAFETLEPFDTSTGIVTLAAGDEIQVRSGTVSMTKKLNLAVDGGSGTEVVFKNYPAETPTVSFSGVTGTRQVDISGSYITFDGINFENANGNMFYLDGATNITIDNATITSTGKGGVAGSGVYLTNGSSVSMNTTVVDDTLDYGVYVGGTSSLTGTDLTTKNADKDGISVSATASTVTVTGGFSAFNAGDGVDAESTVTFKKFAAVHNVGDGINVNDTVAATLHNNTTYRNDGTGFVVAGAAHDLTNNLSWQDGTAFSGDASQSETTNSWNLSNPDPRFMSVSFGEADYLKPYGKSDVIDAGTDVSLAFNDDAPDLGAVEGTEITAGGGNFVNGYELYSTTGTRALEDFESFTISTDLEGDTANMGFETNADRIHDGTQALESTANVEMVAWFSDSYTGEKKTYAETTYESWHWGWNGVTSGIAFMADDTSTGISDFTGYTFSVLSRPPGNTDELKLERWDNGVETTLDSHIATDFVDGAGSNVHKLEVTIDTNGNITAKFYNNGAGTATQTLTATDTTYKSGRLGFYANNSGATIDDMNANTTTAGSPAPVVGNKAEALSDGVTAQSEIILVGESSTANADMNTIAVEVKPVGDKVIATTDALQASADLAVFGSMVQSQAAMLDITADDARSVLFGVSATAGSDTLTVTANPEPVGTLSDATSDGVTPTEDVAVTGTQAVSGATLNTPISNVFINADVLVANSGMTAGTSNLVLVGNKADAEMLSKAVQADVSVFVDSVEGLVSDIAPTAHVAAQGATTAILMEVLPGSSTVTASGSTATALSSITNVSVDVITVGEKATVTGSFVPAVLGTHAVRAFAVKALSAATDATTSNVTASGNKATTEAGTFANDSNLQQFNTVWTKGSATRTIGTKGSKEYKNQ